MAAGSDRVQKLIYLSCQVIHTRAQGIISTHQNIFKIIVLLFYSIFVLFFIVNIHKIVLIKSVFWEKKSGFHHSQIEAAAT